MLNGKTAVVTGGAQGIGAAIALKFASMGADIAILCRSGEEAAAPLLERIRSEYGVNAKAYRCDVSSYEDSKAAVAEIKKDFGTVHILVNNAADQEKWNAFRDSKEALAKGLAGVGRENFALNQINLNEALDYLANKGYDVTYKGKKVACGGKISRKNKK